jgi:hypothetical protein
MLCLAHKIPDALAPVSLKFSNELSPLVLRQTARLIQDFFKNVPGCSRPAGVGKTGDAPTGLLLLGQPQGI